ncbi:MAG: DNA replication/repair protein RecF [Sphingomicrobium sp.]
MPVSRLALTQFRSYSAAVVEPGPGFVLLFGDNGAGKTNLLEAVSMLAPGRGLRAVPLSDMARQPGSGGWAVTARLGDSEIGTGTQTSAPERRQVRINGAPASVNTLGEWVSILWLTPAMDRLFTASAGDRRRFLDRLVLAIEPGHAHHSTRYEAAMRSRNKLLSDEQWDETWLDSLELAMAEHGSEVADARWRTVDALDGELERAPDDAFARASLALEGWSVADIAASLRANRGRDAVAGRATAGPHRQDLIVTHRGNGMRASSSSTGEQKAVLLGLVLAHADLVQKRRGEAPILLLDEVAAHLDPTRRAALFARLEGRGQVWMTATEEALFDGIAGASRFAVTPGAVTGSGLS